MTHLQKTVGTDGCVGGGNKSYFLAVKLFSPCSGSVRVLLKHENLDSRNITDALQLTMIQFTIFQLYDGVKTKCIQWKPFFLHSDLFLGAGDAGHCSSLSVM